MINIKKKHSYIFFSLGYCVNCHYVEKYFILKVFIASHYKMYNINLIKKNVSLKYFS